MSAQEYLETLAAEHQKRVDDYRALQEAKEQEQIEKIRQEYDIVHDKMPVELTYFPPKSMSLPLAGTLMKHIFGMGDRIGIVKIEA